MYSPDSADSASVVTLEAIGPPAAASKSTNQSEPFGASFGCLWTV
jgi:hypothetical protein